MVPLEQLKSLLGERRGAAEEERQPASSLYECSVCDRVYVSEEMGTCPECGSSLGNVPDERDLGLLG